MNRDTARALFEKMRKQLSPKIAIPMTSRGRKKAPAYLTAIVNMLVEAHVGDVGLRTMTGERLLQ